MEAIVQHCVRIMIGHDSAPAHEEPGASVWQSEEFVFNISGDSSMASVVAVLAATAIQQTHQLDHVRFLEGPPKSNGVIL
jgi:hypothetical protein